MKRNEETQLRSSLIEAITAWWDRADGREATNVPMPLIGDATLVYMAEAALGVPMAIDDVQTYLREGGLMVDDIR